MSSGFGNCATASILLIVLGAVGGIYGIGKLVRLFVVACIGIRGSAKITVISGHAGGIALVIGSVTAYSQTNHANLCASGV